MLPRITIVTPSYNQGNYLEETINSVLSQGYPNLDYIIIDGGSRDNSVEIIRKYEKHLTYWVSEKDSGQSEALNKGLKRTTGDIFNWLNSDDYLEAGALHLIGDFFASHPEVNVLAGKCRLFGNNFETIYRRLGIGASPEDSIINLEMNQPSTFYRTRIINEFGGIKNSLHYSMDLELWFRYLASYGHEGIHFSDAVFSHFRIHGESKTDTSVNGFLADEKQLLHYIVNGLQLPQPIISFLAPAKIYYDPVKEWSFTSIERQAFMNELSEKYLGEAFQAGNKKAARKMLLSLIKSGRIKVSRRLFGLIYHLFLKPA